MDRCVVVLPLDRCVVLLPLNRCFIVLPLDRCIVLLQLDHCIVLLPLDRCFTGAARLSQPERHSGLSVVSLQAVSGFPGYDVQPVRAEVCQ